MHEGTKLVSGGKDSKVMIFNGTDYTQEKVIDVESSYPRAIDFMDGKILIGMRNASIFEIDLATEEKTRLMAGHHDGETWGLEVVKENHSLFTIGDDNKVLQFDYEARQFVNQGTISEKSAPKNKAKAKSVTASTLSPYPVNQMGRSVA